MSFRTFKYSVEQGFKNIRRNKMYSLASIGTIAASLFILGILFFVVVNFKSVIQAAESSVGITVFFDEGINQAKIDEIGQEIEKKQEVKSIEFVSGEETWQKYKEEYLSEDLAESFGEDNPLKDSDSYTVYLKDTAYQDTVVEYIKDIDGVRNVNFSDTIAEAFTNINSILAIISVAIIIILIAVSIFLINSSVTMGVTARREEISIMKLLGAKHGFISSPFIIEGIIIGVIGSIIPIVVLYFIYDRILEHISKRYISIFNMVEFADISEVFATLLPIILIVGIGIGFLSSLVTVNRQIRRVEVS